MSNLHKSGELIEHLRKSGKSTETVYAYAFGMAWAWLSDKQREQVLKSAEKMAKESEQN